MVLGGVVEIILGVAAEGKSLEDVAHPLSLVRQTTSSASDLAQEGTWMHKHAS